MSRPQVNKQRRELRAIVCTLWGRNWDELTSPQRVPVDQCVDKLVQYIESTTLERKTHYRKNPYQSFCGWGTQSGALFVSVLSDATCKNCQRLAKEVV